jgi:GcrA cell cycle regulator
MSWTDERIETLTKMWEGGSTASQIADELGGVSRNAVIGKAHRLGLKARPSPVKPNDKPDVEAPVAAKPSKPADPAPRPAQRAAAPVAAPRPAAPIPGAPAATPSATPQPRIVSVGPGGFLRQGPGSGQAQRRNCRQDQPARSE